MMRKYNSIEPMEVWWCGRGEEKERKGERGSGRSGPDVEQKGSLNLLIWEPHSISL
jgi:hypothetical protein